MVSWMISRLIALVFGTLYPAYSSYKAVRTKNVREYVKWMMYWIVFAIFTAVETFTDLVLAWFPFYYELKIFFVIWLLSPYTKGSSTLYRKFVHPALSSREHEIDEYLTQAKERSYETVMSFGKRGLNLATSAAVTAAAKGQGALSERLRSFSMQDLTLIHPDEPSRRAGSTLDTIDDSGDSPRRTERESALGRGGAVGGEDRPIRRGARGGPAPTPHSESESDQGQGHAQRGSGAQREGPLQEEGCAGQLRHHVTPAPSAQAMGPPSRGGGHLRPPTSTPQWPAGQGYCGHARGMLASDLHAAVEAVATCAHPTDFSRRLPALKPVSLSTGHQSQTT
ncbi:receptor expression-enhancing protein 2-like isoform X1 [Lampetra fluviatilis]